MIPDFEWSNFGSSLYLHNSQIFFSQGDHEHLVSFMDAHLANVDDPQFGRKYPYERSVGMTHSKYCIVCSNRVAKWVTSGNQRVNTVAI